MTLTYDDEYKIAARRGKMREESRAETDAIVKLAGFTISHVWELTNQYWGDSPMNDDVRTPWWLVMTEIGPIRIGRRKRVIEIEWDACAVRAIVTDDEVTKKTTLVHAWTVEKAITYLKELRRAATKR